MLVDTNVAQCPFCHDGKQGCVCGGSTGTPGDCNWNPCLCDLEKACATCAGTGRIPQRMRLKYDELRREADAVSQLEWRRYKEEDAECIKVHTALKLWLAQQSSFNNVRSRVEEFEKRENLVEVMGALLFFANGWLSYAWGAWRWYQSGSFAIGLVQGLELWIKVLIGLLPIWGLLIVVTLRRKVSEKKRLARLQNNLTSDWLRMQGISRLPQFPSWPSRKLSDKEVFEKPLRLFKTAS
jgi:hypothetical protein